MQTITPCLWYDGKAEEAANFYVSIFPNSAVEDILYSGATGPGPEGSILSVTFLLAGQSFIALNGGPQFRFSPALSLFVSCRSQQEIDDYWEKLSAGGEKGRCGWLQDRYGVSWQVVPEILGELLQNTDSERSAKAMQAMLQMDKIDIEALGRIGLPG